MPSRTQRELALIVTGRDVNATKTLKSVNREINKLGSIAGKAGTNLSRNLEHGVVLGAGAAVGAIGYAINAAQDWESAMAGVAKTVDGDVTQIGEGIREMSRTLPLGANELAGLAESAGALGIAKDDILDFTKVAATLGVTTNVSADDAATALGQLGNVLDLHSQDFERFGSTLVDLGNKGASTEAQILEITRRAGGAAHLLGVAADETLGWSSAMANLGMNEELAGTALQSFFTKSLSIISAGGGELRKMAKVAGMTGSAFQKAFKKDASGALETFVAGLAKLPKDQRLKAVQDLFGKTSGLNRGLLGLADSYERNLAPSIDTASKAWKENTAMAAEAEKRYKTTASQMAILKNNVHDAAITVGSELLPEVNALAKEGVDWLGSHQPEIKQFAKDLAVGIRDAVKWAKSLDWGAIADALKAGAGAVKTMVDVFATMPSWAQQLLVGGFVANKLTGGAVSDLVGELGKGLIRGVLGMNAGVVNINAGVVNGAGGLGAASAAGGAGAAGAASRAMSLVSKVFIVGLAAEAASALSGPVVELGKGIHEQIFGDQGDPLSDFGKAWTSWQQGADWPFGQKMPSGDSFWTPLQQGLFKVMGGKEPEPTGPMFQEVGDAIREALGSTSGAFSGAASVITAAIDATSAAEIAAAHATGALVNTAILGTSTRHTQSINGVRDRIEANRIATQSGLTNATAATAALRERVEANRIATTAGASKTAAAATAAGSVAKAGGLAAAAAIAAKDLAVTFSPQINTSVSVRETIVKRTTYKKYYTTAS